MHHEYLLQVLTQKPTSTRVVTGSYYYTDIEEQTPCFYWLVYMANQEGRPVWIPQMFSWGIWKADKSSGGGKTFSLHHFLCVSARTKTYSGALEFLPSLRVIKLRNIPGKGTAIFLSQSLRWTGVGGCTRHLYAISQAISICQGEPAAPKVGTGRWTESVRRGETLCQ